ncbi:zf-HC2 domain-containing protein [Maribrevibacterium harenarium]|uniref:Zf-HC2 domain-containing protein n=1 Tax=Maribrevibacterium harenarium TaxID=2589817 RepID=A0A501WIH9_9GAMM|nr:zf-HC2 domain-containing protein [Maribrevibacterium harenarium]TPE47914.1 zf-HC2 domain-containing protein [Maribrevibacterium harenarium]
MKCTQATQLLSQKMERHLSTKEHVSLKLHTAMCPACRRFGEQMEQLRDISKTFVSQPDNNPSATDEKSH